jgi:diguanylate cyclase (GGDEF)-like protein/PAS domain S-box-containing protein
MKNGEEIKVNIGDILRKRYVLALSIIAILVILSQAIIQYAISRQVDDSRVINIAGRQRMLCQRINKAVFGLYLAGEEAKRSDYLSELALSADLWKESHLDLQNGNVKLGLPGKNSSKIHQLFDAVEPNYKSILMAANEIITLAQSNIYTEKDMYPQITKLTENASAYLIGMDNIVSQYDKEAREKVVIIRYLEIIILLITFFVLSVEAMFIFKPAEKLIRRIVKRIEENQQDLQTLFETAPTAMFLIEEESLNILYINQIALQMLAISRDETIGKPIDYLLNMAFENNSTLFQKIEKGGAIYNEEAVLENAMGSARIVLVSSSKISFHDRYAITLGLSDISKQKEAEAVLEQYATMDEMTGLLNKRSGILILEKEIEKAKREIYDLCISFIDIDGLKSVNDLYGHEEGDWYITSVTKIILAEMRAGDVAYRYGGDEIVLIFCDCILQEAHHVMKRIEDSLNAFQQEYNKPYKLSFSFGITDYKSVYANTVEAFTKYADELMYENKKAKRQNRETR